MERTPFSTVRSSPEDGAIRIEIDRKVMRKVVIHLLSQMEADSGLHELLCGIQQSLGYIPAPAIGLVADRTTLPASDVFETVRRDDAFALQPPGRHQVAVCLGKRCRSEGGLELAEHARTLLGIGDYETTADHAVRFEPYYCFGVCEEGANVRMDGVIHGHMSAPSLTQLLTQLIDD